MMITLIKIGGSLITDKTQKATFRRPVMQQIASELANFYATNHTSRIIIGHGSGSFGHFEAKTHNTIDGVATPEQWNGFARVGRIASELNTLVIDELHNVGLPAFRFQPSASAIAQQGKLLKMDLEALHLALAHPLLPVLYGDVAFDTVQGGTIISTETIFTYLAKNLPVTKIILLGEVDGVLNESGQLIPHIHTKNIDQYQKALKGSEGVDVTGGMLTKVSDMLSLAQSQVGLAIHIINGKTPLNLRDVLAGKANHGTLITA